jgi:hypothetical protein
VTIVFAYLILWPLINLSHVAGHLLVARLFGIAVDRVSLGLGPSVFSRVRGKTTYRIALLPIAVLVRLRRLTCATADPNCCHLGCILAARRKRREATKLPSPSQARVVGPAELTVRRRCPAGSRTTGVARLNENRLHWRGCP